MIPEGSLVVLDTNVLVHLIRGGKVGRRIEADHGLSGRADRPVISFVTLGEVRSLAAKFRWGKGKVGDLESLLEQLVVVNIHQGDILDHYVRLDRFSEENGRRMGKNDLWIAATAVALSAVLLTTDHDFDALAEEGLLNRVKIHPHTGATLAGKG